MKSLTSWNAFESVLLECPMFGGSARSGPLFWLPSLRLKQTLWVLGVAAIVKDKLTPFLLSSLSHVQLCS